MNATQTPEAQILQLLREFNPFEGRSVVKTHQIWDDNFLDVPSINSHASDAVFESIALARKNNVCCGLGIVAPKGTGKTHILSRIRHRIANEESCCFIYLCEYGNLSSVKTQFLNGISSSLKKQNIPGVMQWQELATILLSKATDQACQPKNLVVQFPKILAKHPKAIDYFATKVGQTYDVDNPNVVRAILWTLSPQHALFATNWLAGRDLSEGQAKLLGLPESSINDDGQAFSMAIQILDLLSSTMVPILCFDELDGTESVHEEDEILGGFTRAMTVASLAKDVFNNLKRGVILSSTYLNTFRAEISAIVGGGATGAVDRLFSTVIELTPLKPDTTTELVAYWLDSFYKEHDIVPPYPLYPFNEKTLREIGEERPTVRDVLQWCAKNLPITGPIDPLKKLQKLYQKTASNLEDFSEDSNLIASSIAFGFSKLREETLEGVRILSVENNVKPYAKHNGYVQFKVIGDNNGDAISIGVSVVQQNHGRSVGAAIKYLTNYKDLGLTRGCLIRQKKILPHWQGANHNLDILCKQQGGEWVGFKNEEIEPLIILFSMLDEIDWDEMSKDDFDRFILTLALHENPILLEILSAPSGDVPDDTIDKDSEIEELLSQQIEEMTDLGNTNLDLELTIAL
jgi:hypothetical protein